MKSGGVFITGTDTGVGKTVVAATLLLLLRRSGIDAVPMKPVQTGCEKLGAEWIAPDIEFALSVAGLDASCRDEMGMMCPYRFEPACSPHLAAERSGRTIEVDHILDCFQKLAGRHKMVVVEGAGGVLVPVAENVMMVDLMVHLGLPVILVARPGLGTINHTLLSLRGLNDAGLNVLGVIFNEIEAGSHGYIEQDNCETIRRLGKTGVLGHMPFIADIGNEADRTEAFLSVCAPGLASLLAVVRSIAL